MNATLNSLGGNSISASVDAIYPEDDADWSNWEYPKMTADDYITQDMLDELQETYPDEIAGFGISAYLGSGQIYKNSDKYANVDATGTTKEELEHMKIKILRGRNLTKQDMKKEKRVCVVSDTMASYYFGSEDPIGQQIIYSGSDGYSYEFTVVGVYEYNAAIFGKQDTTIPEKDRSTTMYIPATTANKLNHSETTNGYTYISVLLKTGADQKQAETDIHDTNATNDQGNCCNKRNCHSYYINDCINNAHIRRHIVCCDLPFFIFRIFVCNFPDRWWRWCHEYHAGVYH